MYSHVDLNVRMYTHTHTHTHTHTQSLEGEMSRMWYRWVYLQDLCWQETTQSYCLQPMETGTYTLLWTTVAIGALETSSKYYHNRWKYMYMYVYAQRGVWAYFCEMWYVKNTPTSYANSLALVMCACSDSMMLLLSCACLCNNSKWCLPFFFIFVKYTHLHVFTLTVHERLVLC